MDTPEAAATFTPYSFTHVALLVMTVIGALLLSGLVAVTTTLSNAETFPRVFAGVQLAVTRRFHHLLAATAFFRLAAVAPAASVRPPEAGHGLRPPWSRRPWALALTYYWV